MPPCHLRLTRMRPVHLCLLPGKLRRRTKISRNAMRSFRRRAQRTLRNGRINLNGAKSVCRNRKARRCEYRPKSCNFEYGDAADPFIEDEWKMLALVARYRPTCSMDTGRLVSGQFRFDSCMKKKSIIDHRKKISVFYA